MSYDQGALLEPLGVALHAVRKASLAPGSSCLVIGAGAVGLMCAAAARAAGCASIVMADIAENRLQFALSRGFASAVSPMSLRKAETLEDKLACAKEFAEEFCKAGQRTGEKQPHKFAATFECTGVESCVQAAIYATRASGKVLLVGMGSPIQTLPIAAATHREVDLIGVWRYANTYPESIDIMSKAGQDGTGIPDLSSIITHRFEGLQRVPEAFDVAARSTDVDGKLVVKVVVHNS
ncbi:hypothetical protein AYL99_01585 [Fonsecaea erecta]|uniref:Alcohol dehydrogenase-like C-terminal domain-containing protein n=1 Tax=Fonsecaea erecta TaxID=1367422 RepID=A0A179A2I9_9EURO|nr:hypothetical protein AYL99_01585 [Fonsecaea erecta]OAP65613.1 hypothetical protein AYL99_01585 [Fonsecaea erecta]